MDFPKLSNEFILSRLEIPGGKVNMVLDTDTYNEIDDQFALVYALKSQDRLNVEAVYAAPFLNDRSTSPKDGMLKSYDEIIKILKMINVKSDGFVFKGSECNLENMEKPCESEAADDLVRRALNATEPLYVVTIGALTNIASAILKEPKIIEKIVVIWLGGNSMHWRDTLEFNLLQDLNASKILFDCGVPLIQIPCMNVASHLTTTVPELEKFIDGVNPVGTYLTSILRECFVNYGQLSRVIWDISAIAFLINPNWVPAHIVHSPILTNQVTWSFDNSRHFIKSCVHTDRDSIFRDLFKKIVE